MSIQNLQIGIKTEVLMRLRYPSENVLHDLDAFGAFVVVVAKYNEIVGTTTLPRMHSDIYRGLMST
jgi:hypothetical protein